MNNDELWNGLHDELVNLCSDFIAKRGRINNQSNLKPYQYSDSRLAMNAVRDHVWSICNSIDYFERKKGEP